VLSPPPTHTHTGAYISTLLTEPAGETDIHVTMGEDGVVTITTLDGGATVVTADILVNGGTGVINIIDMVLLPTQAFDF
jgi:uncharacterized surface protein with fasciclin (FAS1) repeats